MAEGANAPKKACLWAGRKPELHGTVAAFMWDQRVNVFSNNINFLRKN